jgi:hypothetical protein
MIKLSADIAEVDLTFGVTDPDGQPARVNAWSSPGDGPGVVVEIYLPAQNAYEMVCLSTTAAFELWRGLGYAVEHASRADRAGR